MAKKRSLSQWQAFILQQKSSNLSIADFCQQQGLTKSIFYKYKKTMKKSSDAVLSERKFIRVNKRPPELAHSSLSIGELKFSHCSLQITQAMDAVWLAALIKALS